MKTRIENSAHDAGLEMGTTSTKRTYTKANVSEDVLFWFFGVEIGFIDTSIHSMEDLEKAVDKAYPTKEAIEEIIHKYDLIDDYVDKEF